MAGKGGASYLLMKHKPQIIRELDVSRTLPPLVNRGIFNYSEEQEIVQHTDPRRRTETFVDLLSMKGLNAFHEFCKAVEYTNPRLFTAFLLDNPGKLNV